MNLEALTKLGAAPIILTVASIYAVTLPTIYGVVEAMKRGPRQAILSSALWGVTKGLFFGALVFAGGVLVAAAVQRGLVA